MADLPLVLLLGIMDPSELPTGWSAHGTPESSLGVTTTSSSDIGVPRPQPKRALPAAPALPVSRKREEPDRSRHQQSHDNESRASSDTSSSDARRRLANIKKLRARVELQRAELALAEA